MDPVSSIEDADDGMFKQALMSLTPLDKPDHAFHLGFAPKKHCIDQDAEADNEKEDGKWKVPADVSEDSHLDDDTSDTMKPIIDKSFDDNNIHVKNSSDSNNNSSPSSIEELPKMQCDTQQSFDESGVLKPIASTRSASSDEDFMNEDYDDDESSCGSQPNPHLDDFWSRRGVCLFKEQKDISQDNVIIPKNSNNDPTPSSTAVVDDLSVKVKKKKRVKKTQVEIKVKKKEILDETTVKKKRGNPKCKHKVVQKGTLPFDGVGAWCDIPDCHMKLKQCPCCLEFVDYNNYKRHFEENPDCVKPSGRGKLQKNPTFVDQYQVS